jgi:hypothetical protein
MIFSSLFGKSDSKASPREIGHDELRKAIGDGSVTVVDVREPHEFAGGHIPGAINLPLSRFKPNQIPAGKAPVLRPLGQGAAPGARRRRNPRTPLSGRHERLAGARRRSRQLRGPHHLSSSDLLGLGAAGSLRPSLA